LWDWLPYVINAVEPWLSSAGIRSGIRWAQDVAATDFAAAAALGYGRAARILDMMQKDGIIGPPDGSKPREVLKRPDWVWEVEGHLH
jgi:hypothetical protein